MTPQDLAAQLGSWKHDGSTLYRALADQLRLLIRVGLLPPSSELPPERQMAGALRVSRTTVALAYRLLKDEGWLASLQGSGTRVVSELRSPGRDSPSDYGAAATGFIADVIRGDGRSLDLTIATMQPGSWLPKAMYRVSEVANGDLSSRGYEPAGYPPLRDRVAGLLRNTGLSREPDEVIITNGATQALHLLIHALSRRGSVAVVEELTCPTVLASLRHAGLRVVVVPVDEGGADALAVAAAVRQHKPSFVYLIPTYHNPTGWTMTTQRRAVIAAVAHEHRVPLIEDLTLAETRLAGPHPPPPIASFADDAEIYTVGSMSKLYWPGLRIGWLAGPRRELLQILHIRAAYDLGCSLPAQLLAHELLPMMPEIQAERRQELQAKRDVVVTALREHLPQWKFDPPDGGLSVWCAAPRPLHGVHEIAQRNGMRLMLGTHFAVGARSFVDHVRIPFVLAEDDLQEAVERLATYWSEDGARTARR